MITVSESVITYNTYSIGCAVGNDALVTRCLSDSDFQEIVVIGLPGGSVPLSTRSCTWASDLLLGLTRHPSGQRTAQTQPTFPRSTASSMAWALTASVN